MTGDAVAFVGVIVAVIDPSILIILRRVGPQIYGAQVLVELRDAESAPTSASANAVLPRRRRRRHVVAQGAAADSAEVARRGTHVDRPRRVSFISPGRKAQRSESAVRTRVSSVCSASGIRRCRGGHCCRRRHLLLLLLLRVTDNVFRTNARLSIRW